MSFALRSAMGVVIIERKKVGKWFRKSIPVILAVLFCFISIISFAAMSHIQGSARVINYTGIVRGATQRLVKQEMFHVPGNELIHHIDEIITELSTGSGENGLVLLPDAEYQNLLKEMRSSWDAIKREIGQVRQTNDGSRLFALSETYFDLANQAVSAAERYSEKGVRKARYTLLYLNLGFVLLAALFWIYGRRQKEIQLALQTAQSASKAKSDFLSRMSHEIRTPMNGIIGMTAIAKMSLDDRAKLEDCLNKIELSSDYLLALINDILDMSRIESGKIELDKQAFRLDDVFEQLEVIFRQKAEDKRVAFVINANGLGALDVIGDKLHVSQVLINMISNALKFTPEGGQISLDVSQKSGSKQKAVLEFVVTDNGTGISEAFQHKIFEPFEQELSSTGRQYGGTGLGLAISYNFVKMMGGEITLHSKISEGSQFIITLPFELPAASLPEGNPMPKPNQTVVYDLSGARILLAEDNDINAEITTFLLEKNGAVVEKAANGEEAVTKFADSPVGAYKLILMDIQMPVMNGLEACRTIYHMNRADAKVIPIIGLSANAFREDAEKALQSGMKGYLSKPLDISQLFETIHKLV